MKKKFITLLTVIACSPFLMQCASQNDVNKLNYQLRVVNKKVDDMKMDTVGQMQQRQAASSSQIDELRREILVLKGQIDELSHFNRLLKEQNKELDVSMAQYSASLSEALEKERQTFLEKERENQAQINQLQEKISMQQQSLKSIQDSRIKEAELKAKAAAQAAEQARQRANASKNTIQSSSSSGIINIAADKKKIIAAVAMPGSSHKDPTTPIASKPDVSSAKDQKTASVSNGLKAADAEYANGNYKKAFSLYEQYANSNNGDKAVTARFMMGECLYFQKEYDQAILQYQKIISNTPRHPRAASALLKQGMSFENLSDNETAKIIYKKITTSYANSPEASTAKERSSKIN